MELTLRLYFLAGIFYGLWFLVVITKREGVDDATFPSALAAITISMMMGLLWPLGLLIGLYGAMEEKIKGAK